MRLSAHELAQARGVVERVLEELDLDAYLFEIEPGPGHWRVVIECAIDGGWETSQLSADKQYLLRGVDDAVAHAVLLDNWREALAGCRRRAGRAD